MLLMTAFRVVQFVVLNDMISATSGAPIMPAFIRGVWFDNVIKCWRPMRGRHFELARQMANYLAGFVKTHDPNCMDNDGSQMPVWKPYSGGDTDLMKFTSEGAVPS